MLPLSRMLKTIRKAVAPSEMRKLALEVNDFGDSSSPANKNGGLLAMTRDVSFSASY
jgi:hypothetical protein